MRASEIPTGDDDLLREVQRLRRSEERSAGIFQHSAICLTITAI